MQAPKRKTRTQKVQDGTGRVIKEKFLEQREQEVKVNPLKPLNEKQRVYMQLLEEVPVVVATGYAGTSKAQPLYSKVLTDLGWKTMGEVKVGDNVITPENKTSKILQEFYFEDKPVYEFVLKSGRKVRSCEDHLWLVRKTSKTARGNRRENEIVTTKDIVNDKEKFNYAIPLCSEIGHNEDKDYFIDPYVMGILIAEGCLVHTTTFSTADEYVLDRVSTWGESKDLSIVSLSDKYSYGIRGQGKGFKNELTEEIRRLGLYGKKADMKFIPREYLEGSISQKKELLRGLMDGDGCMPAIRKNGAQASYTTTSKLLANQIADILFSLGMLCSMRERKTSYTYKGEKKQGLNCFTLQISANRTKDLFNLPRKIERASETYQGGKYELMDRIVDVFFVGNEDVKCILIEDEKHLYLTDSYVVTHNTYLPTAMAADLLKLGRIDKLIVTRPAISSSKSVGYTVGSHSEKMQSWLGGVIPILKERLGSAAMQIQVDAGNIEFVPLETVKGLSINNAWMLVEEASDLTKEEVIKLITRMGKNSKLVLAGDIRQSELKEESGLAWLCKFLERNQNLQKNFGLVDFDSTSDIVRSEAVKSFIIALVKEEKSSGIKSK